MKDALTYAADLRHAQARNTHAEDTCKDAYNRGWSIGNCMHGITAAVDQNAPPYSDAERIRHWWNGFEDGAICRAGG